MIFRKAAGKDEADILEFFKERLVELRLPFVSGESDADIVGIDEKYADRGLFILVERDSVIYGMGAIHKMTESICEVSKFYVSPDIRGFGFGSVLLKILMETAKFYGYKEARLETNTQLSAAVHLFEKTGFVASEDQSELPKACNLRLCLNMENVRESLDPDTILSKA